MAEPTEGSEEAEAPRTREGAAAGRQEPSEVEFQRVGMMLASHLAWMEEAGENTNELALIIWYMKQVLGGVQCEKESDPDQIQARVEVMIGRLIDEGRIVVIRPAPDSMESCFRALGLPPSGAAGEGRRRRGG